MNKNILTRRELLPPSRFEAINEKAERIWYDYLGGDLPVPLHKLSGKRGGGKLNIIREEKYLPDEIEGILDLRDILLRRLILNISKPAIRRRFTEAHEIGHVFLHDLGNVLHRDTKESIFYVDEGNYDKTDIDKIRIEIEASAFAASLLMPNAEINKDLNALGAINPPFLKTLATKYSVSIPTARQRILRLIPANCFHGFAFKDSGKIICAYPTPKLEKEFPVYADCAWSLNRNKVNENSSFLPFEIVKKFGKDIDKDAPDFSAPSKCSYEISVSSWFPYVSSDDKAMLNMSLFDFNTFYFCLELEN